MKKCRACKEKFEPFNSLHVACSPGCALQVARKALNKDTKEKAKEQRKWVREQKQRLKTKGEHTREAQQAFNAYIRERDRNRPCISCGTYTPGGDPRGGVWDCSHYRSVGACPELRFEELNAHKGCKNCNRDKSGNIVEYRISLVQRLGQEAVGWLEGPHDPKRYTIDDLKAIKTKYRALKRDIKRKAAGRREGD